MAGIETDYLIVGAGATGMAFADMLVTHTDADVVLVDRRDAPGGHWVDAYPFARLHQPSACYGVDSTPLGGYGPGPEGDPTLLERATGEEIRAYYTSVLDDRLRPSGQVRFLPRTEYTGYGSVRSLDTGDETRVGFRRLVDATHMEGAIPATTPAPFEVGDGATCIPVGALPDAAEPADGYVVVGAGKTGQDAILWLLDRGVPPEAIRWVRPRDPWLLPRRASQPGPEVATTFDVFSWCVEAAAEADSVDDCFDRVEAAGGLHRIDRDIRPKVYRGAQVSDNQLADLRRIDQVVQLGYIHRVERDEIVLDDGTVPTTPGTLHVHCAAPGLGTQPPVPIFDGDRITPQTVRYGILPFSAALVAFVEVYRDDETTKNGLCRALAITGTTTDFLIQLQAELDTGRRWNAEPDLALWTMGTRLNVSGGLLEQADDPIVQAAFLRLGTHAKAAAGNLRTWLAA